MKKLLLVTMCCLLATAQLNAKIFRVNNNYVTNSTYINGQQAHDAAQPGDTLYFESSSITYPAFNIDKKLVVMGLGAFLDSYEGHQLPGTPGATIAQIYIRFGASHTVVAGVKADIITEGVGGIRLYRNHGRINLTSTVDALVYHNYITRLSIDKSNNIALTNNFIGGIIEISSAVNDIALHHNTINANLFASHSDISNNIIFNGAANLNSSIFANNVLSADFYYKSGVQVTSDSFNNVFSVPLADIFVAAAPDDRYYQLKPTSPAKGAGLGGADCGMTGGADPYLFNALQPPIPSIYKLDLPGIVSGNTIQVTISTKTNR
ncbi:hypothetical protein [Pedobacter nanyangensis]|uniref:hypothetical protein n=1 Tax=Pedobacter nanyangensis TaxID=1562389 RepID=UPI000DE1B8C3|nr:hypothetical protein [Pedobacter nanyangensis]